jgi:hypothetical protein
MNTQLNNLIFLKLLNEGKPEERPSPAPEDLSHRAQRFWQKTLEAGRREEQRAPLQRAKEIAWDYNVGTTKGWVKGVVYAIKQFINPRSDFHNPDYQKVFRDIEKLPNTALDHGIAYMDQDWEGRGQLNAQRGIEGGMWLLKIYFGAKGLTRGVLKGVKKLIR